MSAPRLWLVRHAPVQVAPGVCYGQSDLPADPIATARCAERLADTLPSGAALQHSTLQRCELLTQSVKALRPDLSSIPDARLRELDFGAWEGRAWAALPRAELDAWAAQLATYAPGGGERLLDMLGRVRPALRNAFDQAVQSERDAVWIAHAGVARCVEWLLSARSGVLPCSAHWPERAPAPGGWTLYDLTPLFSPDAAELRP